MTVQIPQLAPDEPTEGVTGSGRRSQAARIVIACTFVLLVLGLWRLQVLDGPRNGVAAERNRIRLATISAPRGVIYDRSGQILASNAPVFAATLVEADLPPERRSHVLERLGVLLGTTPAALETTIEQGRVPGDVFAPVSLRSYLPRDLALALEQDGWELPGVSVTVESAREYANGDLLGHVLGYLAQPTPEDFDERFRSLGYAMSDRVGTSGIEATYESTLRGQSGARLMEVDVGGRPLRELGVVPPEPGKNVRLSIDLGLQRSVTNILQTKLSAGGSSGVAILSDPRNGEILTMVSLPNFDPNIFERPDTDAQIAAVLTDSALPLFDRAVAGQYPPGSTFKLAVGIGALQERVANRNTHIRSEGGLRVPNPYNPSLFTWFPDWAVLGDLNFIQGLSLSSNVYFATLAGGFGDFQGLGVERVAQYARLVGYGTATGIDLPGEEAGRVPTPSWKVTNFGEGWLTGDTYNMSIGQGFVLATPLQVANVTNAIASGGNLIRPHIGQAVLNQDGTVAHTIAAEALRSLGVRPDVLQVMKEGMMGTLETDQLRQYEIPGVRVAGKTGTAEYVGPRDRAGNLPTHGWFTGFAPAENPEITITVFLEKGGGPSDAVPVGMDMLRRYFAQRGNGT